LAAPLLQVIALAAPRFRGRGRRAAAGRAGRPGRPLVGLADQVGPASRPGVSGRGRRASSWAPQAASSGRASASPGYIDSRADRRDQAARQPQQAERPQTSSNVAGRLEGLSARSTTVLGCACCADLAIASQRGRKSYQVDMCNLVDHQRRHEPADGVTVLYLSYTLAPGRPAP